MDCGRKTVETTCAGQTGYIEARYSPTQLQGIFTTPCKAKAQTVSLIVSNYGFIPLTVSSQRDILILLKGSEFMDTGDSSTGSGGRRMCCYYDEFILLNSPDCIGI